jgi:hypothetical protein
MMLASLNREVLAALGDPIPDGHTFTLYRGVAGIGPRRQARGLSWTSSFDVACWFADRSRDFGKPAICSATVAREEIYVYSNRRHLEEFIVRPRSIREISLSAEDLRHRHARIEGRSPILTACQAG